MPVVVHLSPLLIEPATLRGGMAVVIDVLRASSTIIRALSSGALGVWACTDVAEARAAAATLDPGQHLLGGERGGVRIEGFDLGNSPDEYTPRAVRGKTIVFTTTNGTAALTRAAQARRVVIGALINRAAAAAEAARFDGAAHLICAGVEGRVCTEDVLGAGAIARAIQQQTDEALTDDAARLAAGAWDAVAGSSDALMAVLKQSHGGRNLERIGLDADIERCAAVDSNAALPELIGGRLILRRAGR